MVVCDGILSCKSEHSNSAATAHSAPRVVDRVSPSCSPCLSSSPSAWTCTTHNIAHTIPYTGSQTSNFTTEKKQPRPTFGDTCRTPSAFLHSNVCPSHVCCPGHQTSYSICRAMATIDPSPLCLTHPRRRPRTVSAIANKLTCQSPDKNSPLGGSTWPGPFFLACCLQSRAHTPGTSP